MKNIYFIRHGSTDYNDNKTIQGQADRSEIGGKDLPLNEKGKKQIADLVDFLAQQNIDLDVVLSSPLLRAYQTGEAVAKLKNITIIKDDGLREMFFGPKYEGMTVEDFKKIEFTPPFVVPDAVDGSDIKIMSGAMLRDYHKSVEPRFDNVRHPGGESKIEVRARAMKAITDFVTAHPEYNNICIPSHNGLLRFVLQVIDNESAKTGVGHTEIVHLGYDEETSKFSLIERLVPNVG